MVSTLRNITFDCSDAHALAAFWAEVLGWHVYFDDDPEVVVTPSFPPTGPVPTFLFIPVPEGKSAKNRLHLDLAPTDRTRNEEVERLIGLGATITEDHRKEDGAGWVWMADPEGNEFCIERSAAERGSAPTRKYFVEVR